MNADCDRTLAVLWEYLDDELSALERAVVEAHCAGCRDCRAARAFDAAFLACLLRVAVRIHHPHPRFPL
jgi:predicted anti-sigma-YlaC factor YlaD